MVGTLVKPMKSDLTIWGRNPSLNPTTVHRIQVLSKVRTARTRFKTVGQSEGSTPAYRQTTFFQKSPSYTPPQYQYSQSMDRQITVLVGVMLMAVGAFVWAGSSQPAQAGIPAVHAHDHDQTIPPVVAGIDRPTIQVFTGGCKLCSAALLDALQVSKEYGLNVIEYKIDGPEAKALGLTSAPTIVCDGKVLFKGYPGEPDIRAAFARIAGTALTPTPMLTGKR